MAGVFKSLDKSDIRVTPFRTHKEWFDSDFETFQIDSNILNQYGTASIAYDLKSSLGVQLSGSNYFYFISVDGNNDGAINVVDVDDNFQLVNQYTNSNIFLNLLTGLGDSQSSLVFHDSNNKQLITLDSNLSAISNINIPIGISGFNYAKLSYIPNLSDPSRPADYVIVNGGDSGYFISADLDGSSSFVSYGDLVTSVSESGFYYDSVHLTGSYMISLFEKNGDVGNLMTNKTYLGLFDANYDNSPGGILNYEQFTTPTLALATCPTRQMVFQHNGNSENGFLFTTLKAPEKRSLYITRVFVEDPIATNTIIQDTISPITDAVSILTAKSYYRNLTYSFNEPVHIVSADGLIYLNISRTVTGTNDTMLYDKLVDLTPYIGTSGKIISATINTDHDLVHPGSPTLITILASDNFYVNPGNQADRENRGCLFTVTYNLTEDTISDPIYIGNKKHTNNSPFIGDDFSIASNFTSNHLAQGAIGLGYNLQYFVDVSTGYIGNYFYKLNR